MAKEQADVYTQPKYSWETPPAPIDPAEYQEIIDTEVVIVGGGLAGLAAAVRTAELGSQVILLEKTKQLSIRGMHFGAANSRVLAAHGIKNDIAEMARQWVMICGNRADERLIWLFLSQSEHAMNWLLDKTEAAGVNATIFAGSYKGPGFKEFRSTHLFEGHAAAVGRVLQRAADHHGVRFVFETVGKQLVKENGRVVGVVCEDAEGYKYYRAAKGVVLATGDVTGNEEMAKAYAPDALKTGGTIYFPQGANTGDGHKMGMWAGGQLQEAPFPVILHPEQFSMIQYFYLYVDKDGLRYMNEDTWAQGRSVSSMHRPGGYAYSVFDAKWPEEVKASLPIGGGMFWDNVGRTMEEEWTPEGDAALIAEHIAAGAAFSADTVEELAVKMGVPQDNLVATVKRYNEIVAAGRDTDFGKRPELLTPISKPPFYAVKFSGKALLAPGGLLINTKMQVLDKDGKPIPGLFAVGNASGGLYAVDYPLVISGSSHGRAITWGYLIGKVFANL